VEETSELSELAGRVAALDLGKAVLTACVRVPHPGKPGRRCQEVREYRTTTTSLLALAGDLRGHGVTLVAMEATSDYWKPVFYLLEAEGFTCWLLNARHVKNVPGRPKTDLLTELRGGLGQVSGRLGVWVSTVADHDHRRGCAAGSVAAGSAAAWVA
jgi:transposase